ncbi:VOC family protein [Aquamicrobium segne]|uniref:VOC family protein n=1 Tax=Aquamicrobium segne TaxID=469547 RepID=A0ABW0GWL8_9HYPH
MTHPLDHLVLPTASLEVARARLSLLGFTVSARGKHPFGTENCCVYFPDGTFVEPLAVTDQDAADAAVIAGNVFVARDRLYREKFGPEGFSAVVFTNLDADEDHRRYVGADISAGDRLDFSRPFVDASGQSDTVSFRLAFAALPQMRENFVFACEKANALNIDRAALETHANGVVAITQIIAIASEPAKMMHFLGIAAAEATCESDHRLNLPNAQIVVMTPARYAEKFGLACHEDNNFGFAAIVMAVADRQAARRHLVSAGINHEIRDQRIIIAPAPGQGAAFIFEEQS